MSFPTPAHLLPWKQLPEGPGRDLKAARPVLPGFVESGGIPRVSAGGGRRRRGTNRRATREVGIMNRPGIILALAASLCAIAPPLARAQRGLAVEVSTDRGSDGVYEIGENIEINTRLSDDAYLIVYEIDSEGYVRLLFPSQGSNGWVEGHSRLVLPPRDADYRLVTQGPEGVGYVVAIASRTAFYRMPWYLRPYDANVQPGEYEGQPNDEEGVTREGRIVGDPFVAMERIRRSVCADSLPATDVSSAYATYCVGHQFRYPRYLCYDCHRPGYWAWWDGFDPYYSTCSVFAVRVNFNWWWGYPCWTGFVPYYYYAVVPSCPPYYRPYAGTCYSSWDGWTRWRSMWGDHIVRYKPAPAPTGYVAPIRAGDGRYVRRPEQPFPPGFRDPNGGTISRIGMTPVGRMGRVPGRTPNPQSGGITATRLLADRGTTNRPTLGRFPGRPVPGGQQPIYGERRSPYGRNLTPRPVQGARPEGSRGRAWRESSPAPSKIDPPSPPDPAPAPRFERSAPRPDGGSRGGWGRQNPSSGGGGRGSGGGARGRSR